MAKWKEPKPTVAKAPVVDGKDLGAVPVSEVGKGLKGKDLLDCLDLEIDTAAKRIAALKARRLDVQEAIRSHNTGYEDGA